jgi:hypothetical protein
MGKYNITYGTHKSSPMSVNFSVIEVQYYEHWNHVLQLAISYPNRWKSKRSNNGCTSILRVVCRLISVQSLQNLDAVFEIGSGCCKDAASKIIAWRKSVEDSVQSIPEFCTLCRAAVS